MQVVKKLSAVVAALALSCGCQKGTEAAEPEVAPPFRPLPVRPGTLKVVGVHEIAGETVVVVVR